MRKNEIYTRYYHILCRLLAYVSKIMYVLHICHVRCLSVLCRNHIILQLIPALLSRRRLAAMSAWQTWLIKNIIKVSYFATVCNHPVMKKYLLFLLLLICCAPASFAQGWAWGRNITGVAGEGVNTAADKDGNVFIVTTDDPSGTAVLGPAVTVSTADACAILAKYDKYGTCLWAEPITSPGITNPCLRTDNDGNLLFLANFVSQLQIGTYSISPTAAGSQYVLLKLDPNGRVIWGITDGVIPSSTSLFQVAGLAVDNAGSSYITAFYHTASASVSGQVLTNTNPSGTTNDVAAAKYDAAGHFVWASSFGGQLDEKSVAIAVTPAGSVYIAGTTKSAAFAFGSPSLSATGEQEGFLARLNASGNGVWAAASSSSGHVYPVGLAADGLNNVFFTGFFSDPSFTFNGTSFSNTSTITPLQNAVFLMKTDPANSLEWTKTILPIKDTLSVANIAVSPCNSVWITGPFYELSSDGVLVDNPRLDSDPVYLLGYSSAGTLTDHTSLDAGGDDYIGLAVGGDGNPVICADFYCEPFIVGNDTLTQTPAGIEFVYTAKYIPADYLSQTSASNSGRCSLQLAAPAGFDYYIWNDGTGGQVYPAADTGTFWVTCTNACNHQELVDTFIITPDCYCSITLPNAFTPNADNTNDVFYPLFQKSCTYSTYTFSVYNRWGQQVFYAKDPNLGWDGTFLGAPAPEDVYVYEIVYKHSPDAARSVLKGNVTLLR